MLSLIILTNIAFAAFPVQAFYVKFASEIVANAAGAPFNCCSQVINTGELSQLSVVQAPETITDTSSFGDATVTIQGEAALGRLKARASGGASQSVDGNASFYSVSAVSFGGDVPEWSDTLTMGSGMFKFTVKLDSQVNGAPISPTNGTSDPGADCSLTRAWLGLVIDAPWPNNVISFLLKDDLCDGNQGHQMFTESVTLSFNGGEQVTVTSRLMISLFGDAAVGVSPTSTVDVLNTGTFTLDPVTPGATYTSESGVSYQTAICCTISATAGTGGIITPSGSVSVIPGDSQTFTVIPDQGYRIADVIVDGASQGAIARFTFPNVQSNHSINATFAVKKSVNLPFVPLLLEE